MSLGVITQATSQCHRQRVNFRSFRLRSEQFLRRRVMRPSCLRRRRDDDDDVAYHPARRRPASDSVATAPVADWVPWTDRVPYGAHSEDPAAASRSRVSSRSDVTTVLSSVDEHVWTDQLCSLESSERRPSSSLSHDQVGMTSCCLRAESTGNESLPKIIINNTINLFLTAVIILLISNHNSFRVLFDKIVSEYFV